VVEETEQGAVTVRGSAEAFAQEITAGRHRLIADEPWQPVGRTAGLDPTICCSRRSAPERP
jgi:hypothetical protein